VETPTLRCANRACGHVLFGAVPFCPYCGIEQQGGVIEVLPDVHVVPPAPLTLETPKPASEARKPTPGPMSERLAIDPAEAARLEKARFEKGRLEKDTLQKSSLEKANLEKAALEKSQLEHTQSRQRALDLQKKVEGLRATGAIWRDATALRRASWFFWSPRFGRTLVLLWLIVGLFLATAARHSLDPLSPELSWLAWLRISLAALVLAAILATAPRLLRFAVRRDLDRVKPEFAPLFGPPVPTNGYMVSMNREQHGPFTSGELQQMILRGQINLTTLIWRQGMSDWQPAGLVPGAADFGPLSRSRLRRLAATVAGEPRPPAFATYATRLRKTNAAIAATGVPDPTPLLVKHAGLPSTTALAGVLAALLAFTVFGRPLYGDYLAGTERTPAPATTAMVPNVTEQPPREKPAS
jgi:hypothetical protein